MWKDHDAVCGPAARRQRRRGEPQDGRRGRRLHRRGLHGRQDDPGQRQRAAASRRPRRDRGPHESRRRTARDVRLRRLGTGLRPRRRSRASRRRSRSSARSTGITPTSRSSPTRTCSTNSSRWQRRRVRARRSNAARASCTGRSSKTGTLDSTIGKTMGKKRYKSSTTTRNLRTVDKVLGRSSARQPPEGNAR